MGAISDNLRSAAADPGLMAAIPGIVRAIVVVAGHPSRREHFTGLYEITPADATPGGQRSDPHGTMHRSPSVREYTDRRTPMQSTAGLMGDGDLCRPALVTPATPGQPRRCEGCGRLAPAGETRGFCDRCEAFYR